MNIKRAAIISLCRTPVGNFGGAFRELSAGRLGAVAAREAVRRAGIDPADIDEVVVGACGQSMREANVARVIALYAGLPFESTAYCVQRNCASSLQALASAVQGITCGDGEVYLVGGVESMSTAPYEVYGARWGLRMRHAQFEDALWNGLTDPYSGLIMGLTAENLAERYGISRAEQDAWALDSHLKAFRAIRTGKFKEEIVPVEVPKARGQTEVVQQDEGPQAGLSLERLALYPPVFKEGGTVTSGNSCPINDGASFGVVVGEDALKRLNKEPLAYVTGYAFAGCDPAIMGIGPVHSTRKALQRTGLGLKDIGLIEINEAFAAQVIACQRELGFDVGIANVNGGGIALGHAVGNTGMRMINTLVYEMRRRGTRYGLATMCVGGGQGGTVIVELP
ncbi:MAG: thiolase family protein [Acetobacteraceae bacterium]|nr:thiolase family protein [Acetobacteraceae bacterium]